jgi:RNA polymerase primary sigma factor
MATKVKEAADDTDNEREGTSPDGPLLDLSDDGVKKMIKPRSSAGS